MTTWVDPSTDVVGGAETGREPLAKTASYYRRSWSAGTPFSSQPSWGDLSHVPPSRRELVARPDLALVAMRRILGRVESELAQEAEHKERQRIKREDRLEKIRARHGARHEFQRKIGVVPPTHGYAENLEHRQKMLDSAVFYEDGDYGGGGGGGGGNGGRASPAGSGAMAASTLQRPRPDPIAIPTGASAAGDAVLSPGGAASPGGGRSSPSARSLARAESSPMLNMRSQHYSGLEGLLIPRFTTNPQSPTASSPILHEEDEEDYGPPGSQGGVRSLSPARTPAPLSSPARTPGSVHNAAAALGGGGGGQSGRNSPDGSRQHLGSSASAPSIPPAAPFAAVGTGSSVPVASALAGGRVGRMPRSVPRSFSSTGLASSIVPPVGMTLSSSIAAINGGSRKSAPPLLGWAEPHGQSLGKAPR